MSFRSIRLGWIALCLACVVPTVASGGVVEFTHRATFEASLPAGYYSNNFSTETDAINTPASQVLGQGGTPELGYTITAPTAGLGVFPETGYKAVSNWNSGQAIVVSFTSSPNSVYSASADIWLGDVNGLRQAGNMTVDFGAGNQIVVPSTTSGAFGFAGVTSDTPLTTMTLQAAAPL